MKKTKSNNKKNYVYVLDIDGNPLMPTKRFRKVRLLLKKGDLVKVLGKTRVVSGNSNNGTYVRLKGEGAINFKPKELILLEKSKNFRRVNW